MNEEQILSGGGGGQEGAVPWSSPVTSSYWWQLKGAPQGATSPPSVHALALLPSQQHILTEGGKATDLSASLYFSSHLTPKQCGVLGLQGRCIVSLGLSCTQ